MPAGVNRRVVLVGPLAIKLPRLANGARYFLRGCLCNLNEATRYRLWVAAGPWPRHPNRLAEVYWCAPMGLVLIMRRYDHLLGRQLTRLEHMTWPILEIDGHGGNVAVTATGLVLLDYGDDPADLVIPFYKEQQ